MAANLVTSMECQEKCNDSRSIADNLSQYPIQFGTFSFHGKYYKEQVDNLCIMAGQATGIFCGNMKILLFEDEEYKGSIFGNYNIDINLRAFM
jgi:hypothetical protein